MIDQAKKLSPIGTSWWVGLIQGILAVLLGFYFMRSPSNVTAVLLQFVALFLVIVGLMDMMAGRSIAKRSSADTVSFWRGVVGFVGGFVVLSMLFLGFFSNPTWASFGMNAMGIITLAYGALGIALAFMREEKRGRWTMVIISAIFVMLGLTLLVDRVTNITRAWVGPVLVILGAGLIIYAFIRRSGEKAAAEKAA